MKTRVQKWGNSLALRIPKSIAVEAGLDEDATVDLSLVRGALVIRSVKPKAVTLDELLGGVTAGIAWGIELIGTSLKSNFFASPHHHQSKFQNPLSQSAANPDGSGEPSHAT